MIQFWTEGDNAFIEKNRTKKVKGLLPGELVDGSQ